MRPRPHKTFTTEEKSEMYAMAQNKASDEEIMVLFNCTEDTLYQCISDVFIAQRQRQGYTGFSRYP